MIKGISFKIVMDKTPNDFSSRFEIELMKAIILSFYNRYAEYEKILSSDPNWDKHLPFLKELLNREYGDPTEMDVLLSTFSDFDDSLDTEMDKILEMILNHIKKKKPLIFKQSWLYPQDNVRDLWLIKENNVVSNILSIKSSTGNFNRISEGLPLLLCLFTKEVSIQLKRVDYEDIKSSLPQPAHYQDFFTYMMKYKVKQILRASKRKLIHTHSKYLNQCNQNTLNEG